MTRKEIAKEISIELLTRELNKRFIDTDIVDEIIVMFFDHVSKAMIEGKKMEFRGFGVFKSILKKSKVGRNPNIPLVPIYIPPKNKIKFITSKLLLRKMNP